ncbi:outer membrane beta-barrel protein [uncultured Flavobacterium sp.]|uniref:outer membrane beta-barrel protein n=1 Tax=uncultured Flavobacterium sp. TaxID=165435 RepID=UPI0030EB3DCE
MKKIILLTVLLNSFILIAQEESSKQKKMQVGLHYSVNLYTKSNISKDFNNLGLDVRYLINSDRTINLQGGITIDYLKNNDYFYKENIFVFNPNFGLEFKPSTKIIPSIYFGYGIFKDEFKYSQLNIYNSSDPRFQNGSVKATFSGITINPGLKMYVSEQLFFELSYKYFMVNSDVSYSKKSNVHTANLGFGLNF